MRADCSVQRFSNLSKTPTHASLKIVDVSDFYSERGGGVKTYINQKFECASALGHRLVIIAPGAETRTETRANGAIRWLRSPKIPVDPRYHQLVNERAVFRALYEERPDVVESSSPWPGGWFAARWPGVSEKAHLRAFVFHQNPVAVYPGSLLSPPLSSARVDRLCRWFWWYLRTLASRCDLTVTSSHWLATSLQRQGIGNAEAVPFGINTQLFHPQRRNASLRERLLLRCGIPASQVGDAFLWIAVSRFHPEKRLGTVFRAFRQARSESDRPMGLVVFGEGLIDKWVRWQARRDSHIHLAGVLKHEELANALASADGFLHGSGAETFGLVIAEALCSGLPLVVPDQGGAADMADPRCAERYATGRPSEGAAAMRRLMARDHHQLRASCAQVAANSVYTVQQHFQQLFDLYQQRLSIRRHNTEAPAIVESAA